MSPRILVLALAAATFVTSACQNTKPRTGFPLADSWHDIMEDVIDPRFTRMVDATEQKADAIDFERLAVDAETCAEHIALGYGVHDKSNVDGFAVWSHEAEQWFREIAAAARNRDLATFTTLVIDGERLHCDRCHDAT
ncbi:MAG: hypothetical protein KDB80_11940 [Planctomycetes bacterium]|nr:hypothetical protein [Planctomycetota bacterium]